MFKFPWSNFHELNLDWILEKIKNLEETMAAITGSATPSSAPPLMDGAAEPGTSENYSRGDHRHPTDTSRASQVDLAAEALNRDAADGVLQIAIDTVDAKIKFSSSAPLMDSSSASAGFSDFQARADHVHPTDTSRASQSDFATLKARVDGITGGASPSDAVPLMDGVGSAGDVGAYSRGNHRHPSDTSKVSKTGDTMSGDLTIKGKLTLTAQEQHFNANAVGWVRVATVPQTPGTRCRFHIVRKGTITPAEIHDVTLDVLQGTAAIHDEDSHSDVCYIDQIRYTSAGAVDIHIDQTAESVVGIYMDGYAPSAADAAAARLNTPAGVADTPTGETVLALHLLQTIIPDDGAGYIKLPNGILLQWGNVDGISFTAANLVSGSVTLPVPFANINYQVLATPLTTGVNAYLFRIGANKDAVDVFNWTLGSGDSTNISIGGRGFQWLAIGKWK